MSKTKYLNIKEYESYKKRLKDRGLHFLVVKTSYSRKIKLDNTTVIFNQEGSNDQALLSLINKVRSNAKDYLATTSYEKRSQYIHFFDLFKKPKSNEVIWKVDIRSAYWSSALKRGIILEETNRKLMLAYADKPAKEMKQARLKALGSLATKSTTQEWLGYELLNEELFTQPTKEIYMDICRDVDLLMRDCVSQNQTVIYYYWDCIFVPDGYEKDVVKFFTERDYNVSVEETKLMYIDIFKDGGGYLLSESDDKAYMVRKESAGLIEGL